MGEELIQRYQYLLRTTTSVPYLWNNLFEWRKSVIEKIKYIKKVNSIK